MSFSTSMILKCHSRSSLIAAEQNIVLGLGPKLHGEFIITIAYPNLTISRCNTAKPTVVFHVSLIKTYGLQCGNLRIEVSRRCAPLEGEHVFKTENAQQFLDGIKTMVEQDRALAVSVTTQPSQTNRSFTSVKQEEATNYLAAYASLSIADMYEAVHEKRLASPSPLPNKHLNKYTPVSMTSRVVMPHKQASTTDRITSSSKFAYDIPIDSPKNENGDYLEVRPTFSDASSLASWGYMQVGSMKKSFASNEYLEVSGDAASVSSGQYMQVGSEVQKKQLATSSEYIDVGSDTGSVSGYMQVASLKKKDDHIYGDSDAASMMSSSRGEYMQVALSNSKDDLIYGEYMDVGSDMASTSSRGEYMQPFTQQRGANDHIYGDGEYLDVRSTAGSTAGEYQYLQVGAPLRNATNTYDKYMAVRPAVNKGRSAMTNGGRQENNKAHIYGDGDECLEVNAMSSGDAEYLSIPSVLVTRDSVREAKQALRHVSN